MRKPVEAIANFREWCNGHYTWNNHIKDSKEILAYLDSIPDGAVPVAWPKELTRERLEELALNHALIIYRSNALRDLAEIAPRREKQKVNLWKLTTPHVSHRVWLPEHCGKPGALFCRARHDWVKVGEAEVEE